MLPRRTLKAPWLIRNQHKTIDSVLQRGEKLDDLMERYHLDALIGPTTQPAFRVDVVRANTSGGGEFTGLAAVAG